MYVSCRVMLNKFANTRGRVIVRLWCVWVVMSRVCPREADSCLWEWILVPSLFLLFFFYRDEGGVVWEREGTGAPRYGCWGDATCPWRNVPPGVCCLTCCPISTDCPPHIHTNTHTDVRTYVNTQLLRLLIYADSVDWMTDKIWCLVFEDAVEMSVFFLVDLSCLQSSWLTFDVKVYLCSQ